MSSARSERSSEKCVPAVSASTASATKRRASSENGCSEKRRSYSCAVSTSPSSHSTVRQPSFSVTEKGIIMSRPSSRGSCFISSIILLLPPMRHLRTRNFMHIYFILIVPSCQVRRRRICRSTPHIFCSLRIVRKALRRIDKYTIIMYNIKLRNSVRAKVEKRSVHPEKRLSVGGRMPP